MARLFGQGMRHAFQVVSRHHLRTQSKDSEDHFTILSSSNQVLTGTVTYVHGHWTLNPASAILRVENLPVLSRLGRGIIDFLIVIMPIRPIPKITQHQIEVNRVSKFKGANIKDFIRHFCADFARDWNK
jgi:hypothetical protein